jgi:hypothetical protein
MEKEIRIRITTRNEGLLFQLIEALLQTLMDNKIINGFTMEEDYDLHRHTH